MISKIEIGAQSLDILLAEKRPIALVADKGVETVARYWAEKLQGQLFLLPGGEKIKTRKTKEQLEEALFHNRFGRDTLLVAMGGGALLDLAGFVAATYLRGISTIYIPTTLLAMVDASIGGKTGINTKEGKNLLGTISHPEAILIDPLFLETLPKAEYANGIAEMLKLGLVWDKTIWERLIRGERGEELIGACVAGKCAVVEKDPQEKGLRRILNFGHTIGHALEWQSGYSMAHGRAVALGCVVESRLSAELGYLNPLDADAISEGFASLGFALKLPSIRPFFWDALSLDKKGVGKKERYVLIDQIGHALPFEGAFCTPIPKEVVQRALSDAIALLHNSFFV